MESIEVELSDFTLRRRSVVVSHAAADLTRGLEPGEQLLLHDAVRGHYSGHVADLDFGPTDTLYRVQVGVRLTHEEAVERMRGTVASPGSGITRQDLLDLLGQLRGTVGRHPERPAAAAVTRSGTR
jgi:hypothetical protein